MENEPVLTIFGNIQALIVAIVGLVVTFGLDLSPEQTGSITTVSAIALGLISAYLVREKVSPYKPFEPPAGHLEHEPTE